MEYAEIANKVYEPSTATDPAPTGWTCPRGAAVDDTSVFQGGSALSSGFQGRVFRKGNAAVFAFKGTVPTMASDLVADLSLVLNAVPRQAYVAMRHAIRWKRLYSNFDITLVGHSLGGGLAQILGPQLGVRFVTFNAPGMLEASKGIAPIFSGVGRVIRLFGGGMENAGVNYRRSWDVVGNFGAHIGRCVEITGGATGPFRGHGIAGFIEVLRDRSDANRDPLPPLEGDD